MIRGRAGFSLIELMVALLLGMVLITGVGNLFLSTNKTYTLQDELVRIQENARVALELLTRDVRMSAYTGCPSWASLGNALYTSELSRLWMAHFDKGLFGIPSGSSVKNAVDSNAISESIVVHRVDWESSVPVSSQDVSSAIVTLAASHDFNQGDLLALIGQDCKQVSIFIAGSDTSGSKVSYPSASSGSLYNCTSLQKGAFNCIDSQQGTGVFDHSRSQLVPVSSVAYYIRNSNSVPTLYRKRAGETASGRGLSAEALVEGIEALRVFYGYDSDNDGVVNQYRTPSDISLYSSDWKNITSIKIELLVRSLREIAPEPQPYFFAGAEITSEDNYIRRAFVTTVELRNRGN